MQKEPYAEKTLEQTEARIAGHYCGGRPLNCALFFLAPHVSLASVLHSSESANRHCSTGSSGCGCCRADALKYIG